MAVLGTGTVEGQTIYVTTEGGGTVEQFDSSGNHSVLATPSTIPWNTTPWGLACDASGNLFVSAIQGQTIYKFDSSGTQSIFASGPSVNRPSGLAFDSVGRLYVAEQGGTIGRFDSSGNQSIFASGLAIPNWLAFDGSGNLFVTTYALSGGRVVGAAIEKIDSSGNESLFFSITGQIDLMGLACDRSGNVYTSNSEGGSILKIDPNGNESVFASGLYYPGGLACDSSGNLYATIGGDGPLRSLTRMATSPSWPLT